MRTQIPGSLGMIGVPGDDCGGGGGDEGGTPVMGGEPSKQMKLAQLN